MKRIFLYALIGSLAISGCTTAYKTGQTPDDVYFSPAAASSSEEYVRYENNDRRRYNGGLYNDDYYEDRYLRMRVADRYRWSSLDDYYFYNRDNYFYGGALGMWNNPYNNFYTWNGFYNPYFTGFYNPYYSGWGRTPIIIGNIKYSTPPSKAFAFNPGSYYNTTPNSRSFSNGSGGRYSGYTNGNNNGNNRSIFNNSNRSSNTSNSYNSYKSSDNSYSTPSRSYSPGNSGSSTTTSTSTSSGSSRSSSGSGSSGPVTRPPR